MGIAKLVLEFIKVFLSAHVVFGSLTIIFITTFRKEIAGLITRIFNIKFPGGGELSMSQSEKVSSELLSQNAPPPVPQAAQSALPQNLSLTPEQIRAIQEIIQSERANAFLWEYRYLNFFLARGTQFVLDWLASMQQRPVIRLYDNIWGPLLRIL